MALITIKGVIKIVSMYWLQMSTDIFPSIYMYSFSWNSLIVVWNKWWSDNFLNMLIYINCPNFVQYTGKIKILSLMHDFRQLCHFK